MKNYKKGVLCLMVLSAMSLMAADNKTINVTTFEDENGENPSSCSLREAIETAKKNVSFGGCNAGNTLVSQTDTIQLEEGTYILKSELKPSTSVKILGKMPVDYARKNPLTHQYPAITDIKTKISGGGTNRIFNTSVTEASVALEDIELTNGKSDGFGGAVFAGGPFSLSGGAITNSSAQYGGAIFATARQTEKAISLSDIRIQGNTATVSGSVLAMECLSDSMSTRSAVSIVRNSIFKNGSASDPVLMDVCGRASLNIQSSTIAENTVNTQSGSIIKAVSEPGHMLDTSASIQLLSNTIVNNAAFSTLLYDNLGSKSLNYNILAFNTGKSCRYALNNGEVADAKAGINAAKNALQVGAVAGACDLPDDVLYDIKKEENKPDVKTLKHVDLSAKNFADTLIPMLTPSEYNAFLPMYYPLESTLINVGVSDCGTDQRGFARITDGTLQLQPEAKNTCELGSIEVLRLTAADLVELKNQSYVALIDTYQAEIDYAKEVLKYPEENKNFISTYQEILKQYEELLAATKAKAKYRAIYIDPFLMALPNEELVMEANGERVAKPQQKNVDDFKVEATVLGVGRVEGEGKDFKFIGVEDTKLICKWDPDVKRIMFYRTDDSLTGGLGSPYCRYKLESIKTGVVSEGLLRADFQNIAPIAKDDYYTIRYGSDLSVTVNPLENDSDDGDGPVSTLVENRNKPAFYQENGKDLAIQLLDVPRDIAVTADRVGICPTTQKRDICYGGNITFRVKNSFSPFDYKITYKIYDSELKVSNDATIVLKNTSEDSNKKADGGGGSFGLYGLLGLLGLTAYRLKRCKN